MSNTECAKVFIKAIQTIADNPENLENLKLYLERHFNTWLEKFADTPEGLVYEMKQFAETELNEEE